MWSQLQNLNSQQMQIAAAQDDLNKVWVTVKRDMAISYYTIVYFK